jgi:elongation factor Ts
VYRKKALEDGKPANIVDKIADGAVKKFQKEVCLLDQPYIRDDKKSVSDVVREVAKVVNDTITVTGFTRIGLDIDVPRKDSICSE